MLQLYASSQLQSMFWWLQQYGIVDALIPFILIFAIFYAVLQRTGYFKKNINVIVSLVIALLVIIPHVLAPGPNTLVSVINRMLPGAALIAVVLVIVAVLTGLTAEKGKFWPAFEKAAPWLAVGGLVIAIWAAISPGRWFGPFAWLQDPALITLLIILVVAGLAIWFIQSGGEGGEGKPP